MSATRSRLAFALAAGAFLPAALYAQQSTGSLSGRVTAADGVTPKSGVVVTVIQKGTNLTRRTTTDADGTWRAPALPVGEYKITLEFGNQPPQVINRAVNLGMDTLVRFKWPAEAGATVVVEAAATGVDQVNTTSAEVGVNVDSQVLSNLPVLDRNVNSAAVLAPGVQIIQGSQVDPTKKTSSYIVSGEGNGRGTNFNVDGADNNSSDVGGSVLPVPFDAIDQFQVVTNQYKAEFGRSNAGFLNVVTKSGTNDFSGVVSYQYTNQGMRARRTDEGNKQDSNVENTAALVSGAFVPDKLFYMIATEREIDKTGQLFDPRAVAIYPSLASTPNTVRKMNLYSKVDWNINQMWLASFKYARYYDVSANQTFPHSAGVNNYVDPEMLGTNHDATSSYGAKLTGTFGNVVWESTYNTFDYKNSIRPSILGGGLDSTMEVRSAGTGSTNSWRQGTDPNSYQNTGVKRQQWKNEVTWTLPEHNIKAGADLQKTDYPLETYFYPNAGIYRLYLNTAQGVTFQNAWNPEPGTTVNGVTYNGAPGTATMGITPDMITKIMPTVPIQNPATSFKSYGFYAQDDWTINNNWNLYYGYRLDWDTQLDYYKQFDSMYSTIHAANPMLAGIGNQAPRTHHYGSPRVQVLYKPNGDDNLVFKAGYGKFVASTIDNVVGFSRALNAPVNGLAGSGSYVYSGFTSGSTITSANGQPLVLGADLTPYNFAHNIGGIRDLFGTYANSLLTTATPYTGGKQLLASDFVYPTTQTLTFGVTYKFSERSAIDITLVYSKTEHQTIQFTTDGSAPQVWSPLLTKGGPVPTFDINAYNAYAAGVDGAPAVDSSDAIFLSNQHSSDKELQVKYTYTTPKFQFLATFVTKEILSTAGGSAGSFDQSGGADFYGAGFGLPWAPGPERHAAGTEALSGSFSFTYRFDTDTRVGLLGQWHSGKYYDVFLSPTNGTGYGLPLGTDVASSAGLYGPNGALAADDTHPVPVAGQALGDWNLDLGLRVSQTIHFGKKMVLEPFIQISNLLNNYDYGTNYDNALTNPDGTLNTNYGNRKFGFQSNNPRTAAIGARFSW